MDKILLTIALLSLACCAAWAYSLFTNGWVARRDWLLSYERSTLEFAVLVFILGASVGSLLVLIPKMAT